MTSTASAGNPAATATPPMAQRPDVGDEENRLRAALRHLKAEAGVLERLVYRNRNQHRGAAYFQYLVRVRRDLKLLLGAGLADVLNAVFPVLASRKPANTILVPNKQLKKKPGANHSHYERLLGVARLLSQMAEPVMKAAICPGFLNQGYSQITFLLGRSFFIEFCMAVLALLARVRALIQQMLLDVVSVYNRVTNLTDRKQAVKISVGGVQAFREYYPSIHDDRTILECRWVKDKFFLHEEMKGTCQETENEDQRSCDPEATIQYETLGFASEETKTLEDTNSPGKQPDAALVEHPDKLNHCSDAGASQSGKQLEDENSDAGFLPGTLSTASSVPHLDAKPVTKKRVAFVAVGNPKVTATSLETKSSQVIKKQRFDMVPGTSVESGDLFRKLLDSENANNSLF